MHPGPPGQGGHGDDDDLADLFTLASTLVADPSPLVHMPVGTALKHAGARDPRGVLDLLERLGDEVPRAVRRNAVAKLPDGFGPDRERARA